MKFFSGWVILILSITASTSVFSQVYLGGTYGKSKPSNSGSDASLPELEGDNAFRAFIGNRLSPKFAIEAGFSDLGEYLVEDIENLGFTENTLAVSGFDASVLGKIPLGKRLSIYGRLGLFYWEAERTTLRSDTGIREVVIADELDYVIGGGVEYRTFNHFGILIDINNFNTDEVSHLVYGLGIYYNF